MNVTEIAEAIERRATAGAEAQEDYASMDAASETMARNLRLASADRPAAETFGARK
jgi:hypothetical protein